MPFLCEEFMWLQMAEALYHLHSPRKSFADLPEHVQAAYISDAKRFVAFLERIQQEYNADPDGDIAGADY